VATASAPDARDRNREPLVIGLLGGVGSGKSEVARLILEHGGLIIDGDRIGHELLREPAVKERIRELWGDGVFDASGEVDRRQLGEQVFAAAGDGTPPIEKLNRIVHPELVRRVSEAVRRARREALVPWVVIDAALLMEWGLEGLCDVLVFVEAPEEERCRRVACDRHWDKLELVRREERQLPLATKRARAHHVVSNAGTLEELERSVEALLVTVGGRESTG